jgi:hypothetical protein
MAMVMDPKNWYVCEKSLDYEVTHFVFTTLLSVPCQETNDAFSFALQWVFSVQGIKRQLVEASFGAILDQMTV